MNEPSATFAAALRREILSSERRRMRALAILLTVLLALTVLGATFLVPLLDVFHGEFTAWTPIRAIGPFVAYEWCAYAYLGWRMRHGRDFPPYARFANALVETSLPSVIILVLARHMDPLDVFGLWPPMLYFVFILLSTLRLDAWLSVWTGTVAALELLALALWLLPIDNASSQDSLTLYYHLSRSVVLLVAGIVAGIVAVQLRGQFEKSIAAAAARDRVTNLFGQHVSPEIVDELLANPSDPPSELRRVCILFLDIRGFTAMTREHPPAETVALLNDFFAAMIGVVNGHRGLINKFLGDGFLALFGAPLADPDAVANTVAAARAMVEAVAARNRTHGGPALRIGIGLHVGEAVTGTVGSPQRKEYTVIGDAVNLAARLEQLTKETGALILASDGVRDALGDGIGAAVDLGPMPIRGFDKPVRVWKLA